jgi:glycosyltransferase involved in cell wall biosynthesis
MKLSCITTTCNEGPTLFAGLESVLGQSFGDFEYLIVDDGSTDGSAERLEARLAELKDPRLRLIRQANDGLSGARNTALAQVQGEHVVFLDADDIRPHWAFAAIAEAIAATTVTGAAPDLILCRGVLVEARDEAMPFYDAAAFRLIEGFCPEGWLDQGAPEAAFVWPLAQLIEPQSANKVVRTAFLRATGIGFPNTHFYEDIYFHTQVLAAARRVGFVHDPCFAYFRRYLRPQITGTSGARRFDILAVMRLTLEGFALCPQFHDPLHRAAVLASCLKLVRWCEESVDHALRRDFRIAAAAVLRMADPLWGDFPAMLPVEMPELGRARDYFRDLKEAG